MSTGTPVLERRVNRQTDEEHNAQIRDNYQKLINPNIKLSDLTSYDETTTISDFENFQNTDFYQDAPIYNQEDTANDVAENQPTNIFDNYEQQSYNQQVFSQPTYSQQPQTPTFVTGARADADIFRADNPINKKFIQENMVKLLKVLRIILA